VRTLNRAQIANWKAKATGTRKKDIKMKDNVNCIDELFRVRRITKETAVLIVKKKVNRLTDFAGLKVIVPS